MINKKGKCWCECKKIHVYEKDYVWNPSKCICENEKYLASIMDDSKIICDEVINLYEEWRLIQQILMKRK